MYYRNQSNYKKNKYKKLLKAIGQLSGIFSDSDKPYLSYRAHERIFVMAFKTIDITRKDNPIDTQDGSLGIALKTWVGNNNQKIAEFDKQHNEFSGLKGVQLVKKIATLRNERIRIAKNNYKVKEIIYHVVKREKHKMEILECPLETIDIEKIKIDRKRGDDKNTYFSDGRNTYHFSETKNTLYMIFDKLELIEEFKVPIIKKPFNVLTNFLKIASSELKSDDYYSYSLPKVDIETYNLKKNTAIVNGGAAINISPDQLCLPLYSKRGKKKIVFKKSGLNLWNAGGRERDSSEIYIPYNADDKERDIDFFPPKDVQFNLQLPSGEVILAKVCQSAGDKYPDSGKSIMSNPNNNLGQWLLRDVFEVPEGTLVTYKMLEQFGVDCVIITKISQRYYSIDLGGLGTYESLYYEDE